MSTPNSFDIGTYFTTASIENKLDELLEIAEERSPSQLEYNNNCSKLIQLVGNLLEISSIDRLYASCEYLPQLIKQIDDSQIGSLRSYVNGEFSSEDESSELIELIDSAGISREVVAFCFLYTQDIALAVKTAKLIMVRDAFLVDAKDEKDFAKVNSIDKSYSKFWLGLVKSMNEHLLEHCQLKKTIE